MNDERLQAKLAEAQALVTPELLEKMGLARLLKLAQLRTPMVSEHWKDVRDAPQCEVAMGGGDGKTPYLRVSKRILEHDNSQVLRAAVLITLGDLTSTLKTTEGQFLQQFQIVDVVSATLKDVFLPDYNINQNLSLLEFFEKNIPPIIHNSSNGIQFAAEETGSLLGIEDIARHGKNQFFADRVFSLCREMNNNLLSHAQKEGLKEAIVDLLDIDPEKILSSDFRKSHKILTERIAQKYEHTSYKVDDFRKDLHQLMGEKYPLEVLKYRTNDDDTYCKAIQIAIKGLSVRLQKTLEELKIFHQQNGTGEIEEEDILQVQIEKLKILTEREYSRNSLETIRTIQREYNAEMRAIENHVEMICYIQQTRSAEI